MTLYLGLVVKDEYFFVLMLLVTKISRDRAKAILNKLDHIPLFNGVRLDHVELDQEFDRLTLRSVKISVNVGPPRRWLEIDIILVDVIVVRDHLLLFKMSDLAFKYVNLRCLVGNLRCEIRNLLC